MARPSKGTISNRVWEIADSMSSSEVTAHRADVVSAAVSEGIDPKTASTQFGAWKREVHPEFDGIWRRGVQDAPSNLRPAQIAPAPSQTAQILTPVAPIQKPSPDRHWATLLKNGFNYEADWILTESGEILLDRPAPQSPGVYVFVEGDQVVYVGTTRRKLADRMADYRRGHAGQRTSARIHLALTQALKSEHKLRVLFASPCETVWNGLPVETAAGLEAGLIARFQPSWNMKGLGKGLVALE